MHLVEKKSWLFEKFGAYVWIIIRHFGYEDKSVIKSFSSATYFQNHSFRWELEGANLVHRLAMSSPYLKYWKA